MFKLMRKKNYNSITMICNEKSQHLLIMHKEVLIIIIYILDSEWSEKWILILIIMVEIINKYKMYTS